jgi:hypothetical protein
MPHSFDSGKSWGGEAEAGKKATADPSTHPGTPGLAQDDNFMVMPAFRMRRADNAIFGVRR